MPNKNGKIIKTKTKKEETMWQQNVFLRVVRIPQLGFGYISTMGLGFQIGVKVGGSVKVGV